MYLLATIKNNIKGFAARIALKNVDERVRPGMTANVKIPVATADNVAAVIAEPGVIRHTANDRLTFGELDGSLSARLERLLEACLAAGIQARLSNQIEADIWAKFVWLSVFSGVTAVTRLPAGPIRDDADLMVMCQAAAMETWETGVPFRDTLRKQAATRGQPLPDVRLDSAFQPDRYVARLAPVFERLTRLS